MSSLISNSAQVLLAKMPEDRLFGLDMQLLADSIITAIAILILYILLSYLLFIPVRDFLKKRQDRIAEEMAASEKAKNDAEGLREEYSKKLKEVNKEAEGILSDTRKKALKQERDIVDEAKGEASRMIQRANKEIELEKSKVKDEVKKEMISVASLMAGKIVASSINEARQAELIEETLEEMGDSTWQS